MDITLKLPGRYRYGTLPSDFWEGVDMGYYPQIFWKG